MHSQQHWHDIRSTSTAVESVPRTDCTEHVGITDMVDGSHPGAGNDSRINANLCVCVRHLLSNYRMHSE